MNLRENLNAVLHYRNYDHMPVVAFGYWSETLDKWAQEGYCTKEEADDYHYHGGDNGPGDRAVMAKLGFDFNFACNISGPTGLWPCFETQTLEQLPNGSRIIRNSSGLIEKVNDDIVSIPSTIGTSLKDRKAWEELYLPKLQFSSARIDQAFFEKNRAAAKTRTVPQGLYIGSLYGMIRDMLGVEELSYLAVDDEDLYREIIDTVGKLCYQIAQATLKIDSAFDFAHYWEDICFKNGPLINPAVFKECVAPWYHKISELLASYGIDIVSLDCDGCIDKLVPIWLENGVNTMFPIEVGTWKASIAPWRAQYGKALRGVGGMDKKVFAYDRAAIDAEIERLKPLVDLGGYVPCVDHRIPPDAKFELVQYYCERFRKEFI